MQLIAYNIIFTGTSTMKHNCTGLGTADPTGATYAANQVVDQPVDSSTFTVTPLAGPPAQTCVNYSFNFAPWFVGGLDVLESTLTFTGSACRAHS